MQIPPFLLDQWLNQYHFSAQPPEFDLASSTGPHWRLRDLLALLDEDERAAINETELVYSNAAGADPLRQAIAEMQGVSADQVQIVTGVSEAFVILFCCAAEPGANVILPFPLFPSTAVNASMFGLEIRYYQMTKETGFSIDPAEVRKLTDDKTKMILVNTPHNPTGATLWNEELKRLHDFAVDRGVQFVSDEVYHPIYHGPETKSAAELPHATVLGGFSKALALSGLRIGWIIDRDPQRLQQYKDARGYFTISNAPLAEKFATIALRHREKIIGHTQSIATQNLKLLDKLLAEQAGNIGWIRPRGGMTGFPWLHDGSDARILCLEMARRGVLLAPGDCFGMPNHFRLGFGVSAEGFANALDRLAEYLNTRRATSTAAGERG